VKKVGGDEKSEGSRNRNDKWNVADNYDIMR